MERGKEENVKKGKRETERDEGEEPLPAITRRVEEIMYASGVVSQSR